MTLTELVELLGHIQDMGWGRKQVKCTSECQEGGIDAIYLSKEGHLLIDMDGATYMDEKRDPGFPIFYENPDEYKGGR
jgi:hypothetical protein